MLSIIRNHSFIVVFFVLSIAMGLLYIFNLSEEEQGPGGMMVKQEQLIVEQTQSSQGLVVQWEQMIE